jgi:hypothetical protein
MDDGILKEEKGGVMPARAAHREQHSFYPMRMGTHGTAGLRCGNPESREARVWLSASRLEKRSPISEKLS